MKTKKHLLFGLLAAGINFALLLTQFYTGASSGNIFFRIAALAVLVVAVVASCLRYSRDMDHQASFGEVFGTGFRTTAAATVLFAALFMLFAQMMPGYKEQFIRDMIAMGPQADLPETHAAEFDRLSQQFAVMVLSGILFLYVLPGIIASLLGAALAKKK
ncbi:DUF4199 domain-containing protein [Chitinophaga deserti]|uniref:DUF4199 domain-containing protein n=1 Tax=Chitinophaga deserti TaxID=2164099 RepID=UPI000D6DA650|nr:DUF4199 domain-containing protein [Chitinophaga deserti]